MRNRPVAAAGVVLLLVLTGCAGPALADGCRPLTSAAAKSALTLEHLLTNGEISASTLEAAAAEVEEYIEPVRDVEMHADITALRDELVADMDELLVAIRAYNTDDIILLTQNLEKVAVDVDLICQ